MGGCRVPLEPPMPDPWEVTSQVAPGGDKTHCPLSVASAVTEATGVSQLVLGPPFLPLAGAAGGMAAPSLLINASSAPEQPGQGPCAAAQPR